MRQPLQRLAAAGQRLHLAHRVQRLRQRAAGLVVVALQRRAAAGAALVDQHQVAPVQKAPEHTRDRRGQVDRTLARAAGEEEHRIGLLVARQCRHHRVMQLDEASLRLRRVERPLHHAAQRLVRQAAQTAGLETRFGHSGTGRQGQRQRNAEGAPGVVHLISPLASSRCRSSAPPISTPRTNTIGNVGQPVHIFSALRRRHWLK